MKLLLTVLLLSANMSSSVQAACRQAVEPDFPDPDTALHIDVLQAQEAVKLYISQQEAYLACVGDVRRHNLAVERMYKVAEQYNSLARRFKVRMESEGMYTDLAAIMLPHRY